MWILTLSGIIVFGSLSEMLLPGGVYKKYVQLAVGLMLTTAVLKPLAEGFPEEVSLPAMNAYEQSMDMDTKQRADVLKIYRQRLSDSIAAEIQAVAGADFTLRCEVSEKEEDFGSVERVIITVDASHGIKLNRTATDYIKQRYGLCDGDIVVKYIEEK